MTVVRIFEARAWIEVPVIEDRRHDRGPALVIFDDSGVRLIGQHRNLEGLAALTSVQLLSLAAALTEIAKNRIREDEINER